jgi:hypothetical protein
MTLYYNIDNYEIKDLSEDLINGWIANDNPKKDKWLLLPEKPGDDYYWNNGAWVQHQQTVPENISARQIRLWLITNNIQLVQVEQAIESIQDPITRETIKIEWEYAPYIERNHPMLTPLAQALGLTENQVDQAFIQAQYI